MNEIETLANELGLECSATSTKIVLGRGDVVVVAERNPGMKVGRVTVPPSLKKPFFKAFSIKKGAEGVPWPWSDHALDDLVKGTARLMSAKNEALQAVRKRLQKNYNKRLKTLFAEGKTEIEANVKLRVGQEILREELLSKRKCCEVSGVSDPHLLVASHILAWSAVDDIKTRLDPENVLLLACNWDALFDKYYISFHPQTGKMLKAKRIDDEVLYKFGVPADWCDSVAIKKPSERRKLYLSLHWAELKRRDLAANETVRDKAPVR